jgi:hypothetical protein
MLSCFICGKPTLGLDGIDARLDTFMLQGEFSQNALRSGHFGDCHLACLAHHISGSGWAKALQHHFEKDLRFRLLTAQNSMTVFCGGKPEQYAVIWPDGVHYLLSQVEYQGAFLEGKWIARHRRQRITVNAGLDFNLWFCEELGGNKEIPLKEVCERLGMPNPVVECLDGVIGGSSKEPYIASADNGFDGELEVSYSFKRVGT